MKKKYSYIYSQLLEQIEQGTLKTGEKLPSEYDLMIHYQSSRDTVRKAIQLLAQNGYVQTSQGKGSIVLDYHKFDFPLSGITSLKELAGQSGRSVKTRVEVCEKIVPDEIIQKKLQLDPGELVWHIERVRVIDNEAVILDLDYVRARIVAELEESIVEDSLYQYLEEVLKLKIGYANKEITAVKANEHDQFLLDLKGEDLIINVESYTHLENTVLFQFTQSRHRPDKFRFVDFARRIRH